MCMREMKFYKNGQKLEMNKEHYHPTFIAADVDGLRNKEVRKKIQKVMQEEEKPEDDFFEKIK